MTRHQITVATCVRICSALVCVTLLAPVASAQNWQFNAAADIGIIYTDNLFLDSTDGESETIYSIIPSISLTSEGERVFGQINYRPEAYFYTDNNEFDDVANVLDANMTVAAVPDALFLYASAINFQSIVSPEGQFPATNVVVTNNRVDSQVLELRPYWQQRFGEVQVLASYRAIRIDYDDEMLQRQDGGTIEFDLNNFAAEQGFAWGLNYRDQKVEYENGFEFSYARASANLGYWIGRNLRLFVVGGLETPLGDVTGGSLEDDFYEAGFQWVPNSRLDLELAAGKRTFGDSFRVRASYRLKRGFTRLTYTQEPATRSELLFDRRPIQDLDNLDNFGDRAGFDDRFVQKRGEWSAQIEFTRTQLNFRIFDDQRTSRIASDGSQLGSEELRGASIAASWQPGSKLTYGAGINLAERRFAEFADNIWSVSANLSYALSSRSSVRFEVAHRDETPESVTGNDYTENQARLFFSVSLR